MEKIIEILKEDSRVTPKEIGIMLGLSKEEVLKKIEELEDNNIILKYTTIINEEKLENEEKWDNEEKIRAFIEVKVTPEREKGFDSIAERIYKFPQVKSLYLMSGAYDFQIVVEGDSIKEISMFVSKKLSILENVNSTATHFLLKKYKENGVYMSESKREDNRIAVTP